MSGERYVASTTRAPATSYSRPERREVNRVPPSCSLLGKNWTLPDPTNRSRITRS
jgi:hypothetical protein